MIAALGPGLLPFGLGPDASCSQSNHDLPSPNWRSYTVRDGLFGPAASYSGGPGLAPRKRRTCPLHAMLSHVNLSGEPVGIRMELFVKGHARSVFAVERELSEHVVRVDFEFRRMGSAGRRVAPSEEHVAELVEKFRRLPRFGSGDDAIPQGFEVDRAIAEVRRRVVGGCHCPPRRGKRLRARLHATALDVLLAAFFATCRAHWTVGDHAHVASRAALCAGLLRFSDPLTSFRWRACAMIETKAGYASHGRECNGTAFKGALDGFVRFQGTVLPGGCGAGVGPAFGRVSAGRISR